MIKPILWFKSPDMECHNALRISLKKHGYVWNGGKDLESWAPSRLTFGRELFEVNLEKKTLAIATSKEHYLKTLPYFYLINIIPEGWGTF